MSLLDEQLRRINPHAAGLLGLDDEPEEPGPMLGTPAPPTVFNADGVADTEEQGGGFLDRLVTGGADPELSPEQNRNILRQSIITAGLATLAAPNTQSALESLSQGLLIARQSADVAQDNARFEIHQAAIDSFRKNRLMPFLTGGSLLESDPNQLIKIAMEGMVLGDDQTASALSPWIGMAVERAEAQRVAEAEQEQLRIADEANNLEAGFYRAANLDPSESSALMDELKAQRDEGSQAATLALRSITADSPERDDRRRELANDLGDDAEDLLHRGRAFRNVLATPNPTDLEIINNFLAIETGNPSASAHTVAQFAEQTAVMPFLQPIKDLQEGRTSELDSDIRAQMLGQIRAKEDQFRREAIRFDERFTRRTTASRVLKSDIFPESPTDILRDIDSFRAQAQGQAPQPTIDPGDGGQPVPASALPTLGRFLGGGQ